MHSRIRMALRKDPRRIKTSGPEYEWKFAALVYLRAYRRGLRFLLASNIDGAKPFDDVFLRLHWKDSRVEQGITYLIQLKHAERLDKSVSFENLKSEKGDFSIKKYFELYKSALTAQTVTESSSLSVDNILLHKENINDCRFIVYTTKVVPHQISSASNSSIDFPFSELFSTGNEDDIFSFTERDEYVWNLLKNDDSCELYRHHFLPRLRIFTRQQRVVELDRLIAEEISEIFNGALPRSVGVAFTEYFRTWWERDDSECITHASALLEKIVKYEIMNRTLSEARVPDSTCELLAKRMDDKDICYLAFPGLLISERIAFCKFILEMDYSGRYIVLNDTEINMFPLSSIVVTCKKLCDAVAISTDGSSEHIQSLLSLLLDSDIRKIIVITSNIDINLRMLLKSFDKSYVEIEEYSLSSTPAPYLLNEQPRSHFTKRNIYKRSSFPGEYYNLGNVSQQYDGFQEEEYVLHSASQCIANVDLKLSQISRCSRSLPSVRLSDIVSQTPPRCDNIFIQQTCEENSEFLFVKNSRKLINETDVLKAMSVEVRDVNISAKIPVLRVRSFGEDTNI
ncbi:Ankyrin-2 [Gryllus bimaculatus]|nr:Ankyrin-2 [Gryllus bimaculatus]